MMMMLTILLMMNLIDTLQIKTHKKMSLHILPPGAHREHAAIYSMIFFNRTKSDWLESLFCLLEPACGIESKFIVFHCFPSLSCAAVCLPGLSENGKGGLRAHGAIRKDMITGKKTRPTESSDNMCSCIC